jgi:hypothetical protein
MTVSFSGPLFDGTARRLLEQGAEAAELAVAEAVRDQVRLEIRRRARQRSGYYESRVRVEAGRGDRVVTDSGVVYSDWLQGDAPRNRRSRFKGYRHWDQAERQVDPRAGSIVEQAMRPFIEKMG